jgi:glycosyltransferase involved in cell wall biosynthesis
MYIWHKVGGKLAMGTQGTVQTSMAGRHIAHVVVSDAFAGTERYIANVASGLSERGLRVTIIGGDVKAMIEAVGQEGASVKFREARTLTAAIRALRSLSDIDVVHAHLTAGEVSAAVSTFGKHGRPLVVSTRHIAAKRGASVPGRVAAVAARRAIVRQAAISRYVADRIDGQSDVILTGVPDRPRGSHDKPYVLVAQRFASEKDTSTAIRAWAVSELRASGWSMQLAGDGKERLALTSLARDLGVTDSCHFLGHVPDLNALLSEASLFLATATGEPLGLSVLEAMATGLPVVATASGGHLETVGASTRPWLFSPGDHGRAASALDALGRNSEERTAYGDELREIQQAHFSFGPFVEKIVAWYQSVLDGHPK